MTLNVPGNYLLSGIPPQAEEMRAASLHLPQRNQLIILAIQGNFNNEIGVPLTLLRIRRDTEVAVVEMGISDFGEMHRLSKMARPLLQPLASSPVLHCISSGVS